MVSNWLGNIIYHNRTVKSTLYPTNQKLALKSELRGLGLFFLKYLYSSTALRKER